MKRTLIVAVVAALLAAAAANAHPGDLWFTDKQDAQLSVNKAYWAKRTSCFASPTAHSISGGNAFKPRLYDHFICALHSTWSGRVCLVTVHVVGGQWYSIVLTGYSLRSYPGCGPQDLRRRSVG